MGPWNGMGTGMGWAWLWGLLVIVGVIVLAVVLVRLLVGGTGSRTDSGALDRSDHSGVGPGSRRAEEILAERYARGEIDTAEYEERRRRLQGG